MKIYDKVKLINNKEAYSSEQIFKGAIGRIIGAEIRNNKFYVAFNNEKIEDDYIYLEVNISDLELVELGWATDEIILEELPKHNPKWWCKVEDGFILNLDGERKNKIPYEYNS